MTLAQLLAQARIKLQDPSGTRWPDAELTQWANEAQDELSLRANLLTVTEVLAEDPGNPGVFLLPAKCLRMRRAQYRGRTLTERAVEYFDWQDWDTATGEPCDVMYVDALKIRPWPYKAGATITATMIRRGAVLVDPADVPETPEVYHPYLVHGICVRAFSKNGTATRDSAKVAYHQGEFDKGVSLASAHRPTPPTFVPYIHL